MLRGRLHSASEAGFSGEKHAFNSVHGMKYDIDFHPMRGFPRWEKMLADPANSRPFTY
jgi:hypothetical protein